MSLPTLKTTYARIVDAATNLAEAKRDHDRRTLPEYIEIGVALLAAQEHHILPAGKRGQGRKSKSLATVASDLPHDPKEKHSEGFLAWLTASVPGIKQRTAYNYMDAAKGCGLTSASTPRQVSKAVAELQQKFDNQLTLGELTRRGKLIGTSQPQDDENKNNGPDEHTRIVESLTHFEASAEQILALAGNGKLHADDVERLVNKTKNTLEKISGCSWEPAS